MNASTATVDIFLARRPLGTSFMLAADLFSLAARLATPATRGEGLTDPRVRVRSLDGGWVETANGVPVLCPEAFDPEARPALLFFPTFVAPPDDVLAQHAQVADWAHDVHAAGGIVVGEGAGTFLVAAAGLLDGRTASVLWVFHDAFKARFPQVEVVERPLASAGDRVFTASGIDAGCDLALGMIARLHGEHIADRVRQFVVRRTLRAEEAIAAAADIRKYHDDEAIRAVQAAIEGAIDQNLSMEQLARRHGMSRRSLSRRFRNATGESPQQYVRRLRVEAAKVLLSDASLSTAEVAGRVGYNDASAFSRAFKAVTGQSPRQFRERLRSSGGSSPY